MKLGSSLERRRRRSWWQGGAGSSDGGDEGPPDLLRVAGMVVGLALLGWLIGYGLATWVVFPAPPPPGDLAEVPDLSGLTVASARERLAGEGLTLGDVDSIRHPNVPATQILGQSPLPGQLARREDAVRVSVSLGPERRAVPDVKQLTEERARIVLETSGFVVTVDTAEGEVARGRVMQIVPPPDSVLALPAEVRIVVSTGPPVVTMPLVLGMDEVDAVMLLDSLGLVVSEINEVFRFGRDQGVVVEQEPAADTQLERGTAVRLSVGRRGDGGGPGDRRGRGEGGRRGDGGSRGNGGEQ